MKRPDFYFADHPLGKEWPIGTKQLADYFKVTTRTIFNWRAKGRVPFWRINPRVIRYWLTEVEAALGRENRLTNKRRREIWKQHKNAD